MMRRRDALQGTISQMREMSLILVITFFMFVGFSSGEMLNPLNTQFLRLGPDTVAMLFFVSNVASAAIRIPAGIASDRYGRKPVVLAASASFIAAAALFLVARDYASLMLPFALWGIGGGFYFTSANALIADLSSVDTRVAAFARVGIINMVANMSGPLLAGVIADALGILSAYSMLAIVFVIMAVFVVRIREPPRSREDNSDSEGVFSLMRGSTGSLIFAFGVFNLIFGAYGGMYWPSITIIQNNEFLLSYSEIGLVNTVNMFSQLIAFFLCSRASKYDPRYVMTGSTLVLAAVALIYPMLRDLNVLLSATFVVGFASSFCVLSPIGNGILMNALPASTRGISQGITGTFWRAGMAVGSLAMGPLWRIFGLDSIFYVSGGLLVAEAIAVVAMLPKNSKP